MKTTNDERGYNGRTNWATWNLNLWIANDEMLYRLKQTFLSHHHESLTVEDVEGFCRDILPVGTPDMDSPQDMDSIHNDMDLVDYAEITDHWADEIAEEVEAEEREADLDIVKQFLTDTEEWMDDYVGFGDYGDEYVYLVKECGIDVGDVISKWFAAGRYILHEVPSTMLLSWSRLPQSVKDSICDRVIDEVEAVRESNEYARADDICFYSLTDGEHEEQIELSRLLETIGDELSDDSPEYIAGLLSELDRDFCLRHFEASDLSRKYACFYLYTLPGGRWDYVVRPEQLLTIIAEESCNHLREEEVSA